MLVKDSVPEEMAGNIPLLKHGELLRPDQDWGKVEEPDRIPLHPLVFNSADFYTREFVETVTQAVPQSIQRDIEAQRRILGTDFGLIADEEGVFDVNSTFHEITAFQDFRVASSSQKKTVDVAYGVSANIAAGASPEGYSPYLFTPRNHPMPADKLIHYRIDPEDPDSQFHRWYIHNLSHAGRGGFMFFRNFAIMFNNLGLLELSKKPPGSLTSKKI